MQPAALTVAKCLAQAMKLVGRPRVEQEMIKLMAGWWPHRFVPMVALLALLAAACSSEPVAAERCLEVGTIRQSLSRQCLQQSLDPISDEADPNYGRVSCQMLSGWRDGSPECACDAAGLAPLSPQQQSYAREHFSQSSLCRETCCEELCFCEFLQHSGEALAACQSRSDVASSQGSPTGWCYLEPALGFGTELDLAACPAESKQRLSFYPTDPRYNITAIISCLGAP